MNNLEEFIRANREEFDSKEPREKLWSHIESDLDGGSQKDFGWMWKAAVVVLVAVCGFLIWERGQHQVNISTASATDLYMGPEFLETELYYTQLITQKQQQVESFNQGDPELKNDFKNDLASLDTIYHELKQEYIETGNDVVLDAMMSNLQLRKELLDQELMILEKLENEYRHETNEIEYL